MGASFFYHEQADGCSVVLPIPAVQHSVAGVASQVPRAWLIALAVALPIVLIYVAYLDRSPVYLSHDEVVFGSHGHAIATTGRDLNGRFFPLYFHVRDGYWATPVTIYWMALVQQVLPLSEIAIRLPTAIVGLISLVLLYFLARSVFHRRWLAVLAVVLLASSPAYFIHSRIAVDHIYPVPFMLGWLLCLKLVTERYNARLLLIAGLLLGVGFHSYLAAVILMPLYLAITCIVIHVRFGRGFRRVLPAILGFALPVLLLVPWLAAHPDQYAGQIRMYNIYDPGRHSPLGGALEILQWTALMKRWNIYYEFFNPSFLFFSGGSSLLNATTQAGVLLLPLAVLLPLGIYQILNARRTLFNGVLVAALACAPLPSVLVADGAVNRGLVLLPCAALVATFGMEWLISHQQTAIRAIAVCLLAVVPLQFAYFLHDYHRGYRVRSSVLVRRQYSWCDRDDHRPGGPSPARSRLSVERDRLDRLVLAVLPEDARTTGVVRPCGVLRSEAHGRERGPRGEHRPREIRPVVAVGTRSASIGG